LPSDAGETPTVQKPARDAAIRVGPLTPVR
jgi:hypothetical protein